MDARGKIGNSGGASLRRKIFTVLLIVSVISDVKGASLIQKRSVGHSHGAGMPTCILDNPCGWEVYDPTTRNHGYYVTSSCVCPTGEKCVMNSDDLAVSAYVYTCRVIPVRRSKSRNRSSGRPSSVPTTTSTFSL